jgi:phage-related minor tail protein
MVMSANGNAFGAGGLITAFANGGGFTNSIVDTPTFFNFGGSQLGVMGEAGPEAVMPLTRDGNGRLGVSVNGAGGEGQATVAQAVTINITVNEGGDGAKGTKSSSNGDDAGTWKKMADRIKSVVKEELVTQQRPGGILYK